MNYVQVTHKNCSLETPDYLKILGDCQKMAACTAAAKGFS